MASPLSSSGQALDPERAWRSVLDELKLSLDAGVFHSYVRDAWLIAYEDGEFIIGLPSVFAYEWLHQKLLNTIKKKLRVHLGRSSVQVTLRVQSPKTIEGDDELASTPLYQAANERIPGSDGAGQWAQGGASQATQQERSVPMAFRSRYTSQLRA
jgi:chromosomal replication initiation ATPase DnaA